MKNIALYALASVVLALSSGSVYAQDDSALDRSVDVVNAYQPTLRKAKKLTVAPVMDDTISYNDSFKYQLLNRVETVTTKPDTLSAASMTFPEYESPYRALLQAGVGTLPSFLGQITYNLGASERYHLSFNAGHLAQLGKAKLTDGTKADAPQNDTWANINFHRFRQNVRFGFNFAFKNSAYRYYGLNTLNDTLMYISEDGNELSGSDLAGEEKQRMTVADVDFFVGNAMVDPLNKFTFAASAGVGFFGNKSGVHETDIRFGGALRFPVKSAAGLDVDLAVNAFKVHEGDSVPSCLFLQRRGIDIRVYPHFLLEYDYMKLRLGLRMIPVIGDDYTKDDFIVQPDLNADFFIGDGSVRFYAGMTGDFTANSYRHLAETNRYLSPDCRKYVWSKSAEKFVLRDELRPSQSPILFKIGARASFSNLVQLHIGFDFRSLGDEVFFVNRNFALAADTTQFAHSSQFAIVQDDGKLVRLHGELNVNPTKNSNVRIAATYFKYNMDYIEEAWNRPSCEFTLAGKFKPVERLQVKASLNVVGKRKAYDPTLRSAVNLKAFADLNVGANYYISNRWTAFLDINNICCADQQRWLGYSSYRLNAMAGITYKF